ncbi:hypothetical protein [Pseudooceanicola sp. 200-1SW]|uniref:hypothetical protein n=1 Tax=Pseudooceanicola sp. 200-1SW TaxID=3425949 RepID=UPI003D7F5C69
MTTLIKSVAFGALLSGLAGAAAAQISFDGAVTLGYAWGEGKGQLDGAPDINAPTLDVAGTLSFGNGFDLGMGLTVGTLDIDGVSTDLDLSYVGLTPTYTFSNGAYVGVYAERTKLDLGFADASATSFGLLGGYTTGAMDVSAFIGQTETDPDLPSGVDVTDWGVSGTYLVSEDLLVGGGLARSRLDMSGTEIDMDMLKIGAAYDYNGFTVFGGGAFGSVEVVDVTILGVGVAYDMSSMINMPLSASVEYTSNEIDMLGTDGGYDVWKFGLTFPLGDKSGPVVPQNSVAAGAFDPRSNSLLDAINTAF